MPNNRHPQLIQISTSTILRAVLIILALIFLYLVWDILMIVFVAIIVAAAINGPVTRLQKCRVPRLLGVVFVYLLIFFLISLIVYLIIPPLTTQIRELAHNLPFYLNKIGLNVQLWWQNYQNIGSGLQGFLAKISDRLAQLASGLFSTTVSFFGGLVSLLVILVVSFYLAVQEKGAKQFLVSLVPAEHQSYLADLIERIEKRLGSWLRGQLLLMVIVAVLIYIGLRILGVRYALVLALVAGLLEIVPYLGPIMAAVPATLLAFLQSPFLALLVVVLYIVVQQLENYLIVPQVMRRAVGLHPVVVIVVMLIGAKLAGILGILLSVPLAAGLAEFFKDVFKEEI